jgi:hypothetical protein
MAFDENKHVKIAGGYQAKPMVIEPEPITKITLNAFRRRLTFNEKLALKTSADPVIQVMNDDLASVANTYVDTKDESLIAGLTYAAGQSVLELKEGQTNEERIAEILRDGTPEEQPL